MNPRTSLSLALVVGSSACAEIVDRPNADHCALNEGDRYCAELFPDRPFCVQGQGECALGDRYGCLAEVPVECREPCGVLSNDECMMGGSSGTDTGTSSESGSESGSSEGMSSSTTGPECMENADCMDPAAPFCGGDGECVSCQAVSDPNAACAELDPAMPVCDAGACVQCTGGQAEACGGQTPVCGDDNACVACTEHDQCPDSACHLDGVDVGACFDVAEVVMVTNAGELTAALGALGATDRAVLVLGPGTYGATVDVGASNEVAILGQGTPILAGDGSRAVDVFSSAILYLDGVQVVNASGDGVACSGTSVWLDDSSVRNNSQVGMDVSGGCAAHLRRSVVASNQGGGIDIAGGSLHLRAVAIGRNGDALSSTLGGIGFNGTAIDITYSTIVGNQAMTAARGSLFCAGGESGEIRNSIIVGTGDSIDGCAALAFNNNAVDDAGIGGANDNVGPTMAGWFVNLGMNDYHLTTAGETTFMDIATWQPGDPLTDVDGDPIPTDMPSFPGYDQP